MFFAIIGGENRDQNAVSEWIMPADRFKIGIYLDPGTRPSYAPVSVPGTL